MNCASTGRRVVVVIGLTLGAGCATATSEKMVVLQKAVKITNIIPFDLAACGPRALPLSPVTNDVVAGAVLSAAPAVEECFAAPASRDLEPLKLSATVTVTSAGATVEVSGTGATPAGKACAEAAIRALPWKPVPAGAQGVRSQVGLAISIPVVTLGDDPANDLVGNLRLAQKSACGCYATLAGKAPPNLVAEIEVAKAGMYQVTLPETEPLAACLLPIFRAVPVGDLSRQLKWPLLLKNSYVEATDPASPTALRFQQLEGYRDQLTADVMIATGRRVAAGKTYETVAASFYASANNAKASKTAAKDACAEVVAADVGQLAATSAVLGGLEQSLRFLAAEKAKDPQFAAIEKELAPQVDSLKVQVDKVTAQKRADETACAALLSPKKK